MINAMKWLAGKAVTVTGPVEPEKHGRVMMHEHLYGDCLDWERGEPVLEETTKPEYRDVIFREGIPFIRQCNEHGCHAFVDATCPSGRAAPSFYSEASAAAGIHIIQCTGFYREVELGTYWAKTPELQILPMVRKCSVEELADFCLREIVEGINGSNVRAGALKIAGSAPVLTAAEEKAFRAVARAQKQTGVHITTHCTHCEAIHTQLRLFAEEGVDLRRVVIGHVGWAMREKEGLDTVLHWMRRGANFLPTNMGVASQADAEYWRPLVEAIHKVFDAGHGSQLCFGLDSAFCNEAGPVFKLTNTPPPPWPHLFSHTLPAFRSMGLTEEEEDWIMRRNPQRLIPVQ